MLKNVYSKGQKHCDDFLDCCGLVLSQPYPFFVLTRFLNVVGVFHLSHCVPPTWYAGEGPCPSALPSFLVSWYHMFHTTSMFFCCRIFDQKWRVLWAGCDFNRPSLLRLKLGWLLDHSRFLPTSHGCPDPGFFFFWLFSQNFIKKSPNCILGLGFWVFRFNILGVGQNNSLLPGHFLGGKGPSWWKTIFYHQASLWWTITPK